MSWLRIVLTVGVLAAIVAAVRQTVRGMPHPNPDIDVGAVSDGWLAQQRGREEDGR